MSQVPQYNVGSPIDSPPLSPTLSPAFPTLVLPDSYSPWSSKTVISESTIDTISTIEIYETVIAPAAAKSRHLNENFSMQRN